MPEFRIQRCLGRGGFGEVYKAVMSRGNGVEMDVAIKVLRSDLDPSSQGIQRLRDEGRLLGRMTHPSILRVYDLVVIEGHAALVSEYVAGDDLSRIFKEEEIPQRAAFEVVAQIAAALDAAWSHPSVADGKPLHLVHRDIKPDNIRIDPFGAVKLLDFGIAQASRVRREAHTSVNTIMGSTQYLSPERLVQQEVGPESDVFALGCTAFEMFTGEPLFIRKSMRQMYLLMVDERRFTEFVEDRLAAWAGRLGEAGVALVRDMAAFEKGRRPTAGQVATRCDTTADGMSGPTLRSWCRTRPWSAPPDMTGPLEGLTFVVKTGSGMGPAPPTATARHALPPGEVPPPDEDDRADEATVAPSATPEPAPTQTIRAPETPPAEEPTWSELEIEPPTPHVPAPLSVPAAVQPPAVVSGPSPWTEEERAALVSGRLPEPSLELPPPEERSATSEPALPRLHEPDTDPRTPPVPTPGPPVTAAGVAHAGADPVPDDLPEPLGTQRLPLLERQRSPEIWPLPMVTQPVAGPEEAPTSNVGPPSGEVTVRLKRVPRKRADGSVAPRRRLIQSASGAPVREVTREIPMAEVLAEPTVRVAVPPNALEERTDHAPDPTWPGLRPPADDDRTSDPGPTREGTDEVPPRTEEDLLLEAVEATTGSRHLPSGFHPPEAAPDDEAEAATVVTARADLPTLPTVDEATRPEPPTEPDVEGPRPVTGESRLPRPPSRSLAPLLASVGGLAGLLVGAAVLLVVLFVVWLAF